MNKYGQYVSARQNFVIKPWIRHLNVVNFELEKIQRDQDWNRLIKAIKVKLSIRPEEFQGSILLNELYSVEDSQKKYGLYLANNGLVIPQKTFEKLYKEIMKRKRTPLAFNLDGLLLSEPFNKYGIIFLNKLYQASGFDNFLHESLHQSYKIYSFHYNKKENSFSLKRRKMIVTEDFFQSGMAYIEQRLLSELNSQRVQVKKEKNWKPAATDMIMTYIPRNIDDRFLCDLSPSLAISLRKRYIADVKKRSDYLYHLIVDSIISLSKMEGKYSPALISHIIFSCEGLKDLTEFENRKDLKSIVVKSLEIYSRNNTFYLPVYEEACNLLI